MKRFLMAVAVLGVMALLMTSMAHSRAAEKGKRFIGIWEGIQPGGFGQRIQVSIFDDGNGALAFAWAEDITGLCVNESPNFRKQGRIGGPATINPDDNNVLDFLADVFCFDETMTPPTAVQVLNDDPSRWELVDKNRVRWELLSPNAPPGIIIIFHRISQVDDDDDDDD